MTAAPATLPGLAPTAPVVRVRALPDWYPAPARERLAACGGTRRHAFSAHERRLLRRERVRPILEWVDAERMMGGDGPFTGRPWRTSRTPYLGGVMLAASWPSVREVNVCKTPQTGGTEAMFNFIAWSARFDPGPVMVVFPDQQTAEENNRDRIIPMFELSPGLRGLLTGREVDKTGMRLKLTGMTVHMAWATSVARLANKPIRILLLDETDKYPGASSKETSPILLAEARTTTFGRTKKIIRASTPTLATEPIWLALAASQSRMAFHVRCPHCGHEQRMEWKRVRKPEGLRDPERMKNERLAWYECAGPACGTAWTDADRDRAVALGQWRDQATGLPLSDSLKAHNPRSVGFHVPALLSPFVSLSEAMAWWIKGNDRSSPDWKDHLKYFVTQILAEPWQDFEVQREETAILALADDRPAGIAPRREEVAALVASVDTQEEGNGFYYTIWAAGWGQSGGLWLVRHGLVLTFEDLERVLWEDQVVTVDGKALALETAWIDAMGTRTGEVYDWAVRHRGRVQPCQGVHQLKAPVDFSRIEHYPRSQRKIPGGVTLARVHTKLFKDRLSAMLQIQPGDPGGIRLHAEADQEFARQMCAEYFDADKKLLACPRHRANHYWDASYLALAAVHHLGVRMRPRPATQQPQPQPAPLPPAPSGHFGGQRPGWFGR